MSLLFVLCLAACASTPRAQEQEPQGSAVVAVAERLVAMAELRSDISAMRVHVRPIEAGDDSPEETAAPSGGLAFELQRELTLALTAHMNVIDGSLQSELDAQTEDAPGTTHVVVGDYVQRGADTILSVRLVELQSRLIVATARGAVESSRPSPAPIAPVVAKLEPAPRVSRVLPNGSSNLVRSKPLAKKPASGTQATSKARPKVKRVTPDPAPKKKPLAKSSQAPPPKEIRSKQAELPPNPEYDGPALLRLRASNRSRGQASGNGTEEQ